MKDPAAGDLFFLGVEPCVDLPTILDYPVAWSQSIAQGSGNFEGLRKIQGRNKYRLCQHSARYRITGAMCSSNHVELHRVNNSDTFRRGVRDVA